jgi:hypothetical protein
MKCYRKCRLFSRQRKRRRQQIFIVIGLFITSLLGLFLLNQTLNLNNIKTLYSITYKSSSVNCHCSESSLIIFDHGECFFDQLVCYPGFGGNQCEIQLKNEVLKLIFITKYNINKNIDLF